MISLGRVFTRGYFIIISQCDHFRVVVLIAAKKKIYFNAIPVSSLPL